MKAKGERLALNQAEAARAIGISRRTLARLLADGEILHRRVGSRYLIPTSALEEFLRGAEK